MDESHEFSDDGLDEFEDSVDEQAYKKRDSQKHHNKPYDEAYEISQDLSVAESYDGRQDKKFEKERKVDNEKYDYAVEVSQSLDQSQFSPKRSLQTEAQKALLMSSEKDDRLKPQSKQQQQQGAPPHQQLPSQQKGSMKNAPFDEELEVSAGSDESVDTVAKKAHVKAAQNAGNAANTNNNNNSKKPAINNNNTANSAQAQAQQSFQSQAKQTEFASSGKGGNVAAMPQSHLQTAAGIPSQKQTSAPATSPRPKKDGGAGAGHGHESSDEEGDHEESYENIEGAYNPKDYGNLNVTAEVRDLFQYIDRYKPHEVELGTTLKCFIPEYIPTIGEMDAFIKIPRPDAKTDDLGLKFLDEPSSNQSDPTVLELQLRAMSKKVQYGDVAVRSIEDAGRNPAAIDRWIQNISDLHRSKPPPQVHYKRNMPEVETLMEVWPEEFEALLDKIALPSPDLDLNLVEYAKVLCSVLDIPTYENPIESLHLMFTLYMDFRNNPHFQAGGPGAADIDQMDNTAYGGADVMELKSSFK